MFYIASRKNENELWVLSSQTASRSFKKTLNWMLRVDREAMRYPRAIIQTNGRNTHEGRILCTNMVKEVA